MPRTEFKKTIFGAIRVSYDCPKCLERLTSPLREAGIRDTCPACGIHFIVPGTKRLKQESDRVAEQKRVADDAKRHQDKKLQNELASSTAQSSDNLVPVVLVEALTNDSDSVSPEPLLTQDFTDEQSESKSSHQTPAIAGVIGIAVAALIFVSVFMNGDEPSSPSNFDLTPAIPRLTGTVTRDDVRRTLRDMEDRVPDTLRDMEDNLPDVMADMEREMMKNASEYGLSSSDVRDQMRDIEASAREQIRGMESDVRQNIRDMEDDVMRQLRNSGF